MIQEAGIPLRYCIKVCIKYEYVSLVSRCLHDMAEALTCVNSRRCLQSGLLCSHALSTSPCLTVITKDNTPHHAQRHLPYQP